MRQFALMLPILSVFAGTTIATPLAHATRDGAALMLTFEQGLAEPDCVDRKPRWRAHYARAFTRLADQHDVSLILFAYVLDQVRTAGLPSELALIPFVESRYQPDARSTGGPAGLWQFTASTARRNGLRVEPANDERLSVVISTRAAVSHLRRLHRMFGRSWRQTAIAYNAGEGSLRASRSQSGRGLSGVTRSYPVKLHEIACGFASHADTPRWRRTVDRPLPRLTPRTVTADTHNLRGWARAQGLDPDLVAALNPGWHSGVRHIVAPTPPDAFAGPRVHRKAN